MADPRARIVSTFGAALAVSSTTSAGPFAAYVPLLLLLAVSMEARPGAVMARMAPGAPFRLLAAATFLISVGWRSAMLVALRGGMLLALLAVLTATTDTITLARSITRFCAPPAIGAVAVLMARYLQLLYEEWARMSRARASRCPAPPRGRRRFGLRAGQVGTLLTRSWDRAERIHTAMLARGFTGTLPAAPARQQRPLDWGFALVFVSLFVAARCLV